MLNIENLYYILETSIPTIKKYKSISCCKAKRKVGMSLSLTDLFSEVGIPFDLDKMDSDPEHYYSKLRLEILSSSYLSNSQKLVLMKLL